MIAETVRCERCHKERDPADIQPLREIGSFCSWCRDQIDTLAKVHGDKAAIDWTYMPRNDLIGMIEGEGKRVLDCGCWAGYTLQALKNRGHDPWGLDLQDYRTVAKDVPMITTNLEGPSIDLCFTKMFDYILFGDVIEHLENPLPALLTAKDWLADGGRILVSVPNIGWIGAVLQIANQKFPRDESGHFDKTHLRFYTLDEIIRTLENGGFRVLRFMTRQFPDVPPFPEGGGVHRFQWDNVIIDCDSQLYTMLNAYQIVLEAEPA